MLGCDLNTERRHLGAHLSFEKGEPLHELLDALSEGLRDGSLRSIFERVERTFTVKAVMLGWL